MLNNIKNVILSKITKEPLAEKIKKEPNILLDLIAKNKKKHISEILNDDNNKDLIKSLSNIEYPTLIHAGAVYNIDNDVFLMLSNYYNQHNEDIHFSFTKDIFRFYIDIDRGIYNKKYFELFKLLSEQEIHCKTNNNIEMFLAYIGNKDYFEIAHNNIKKFDPLINSEGGLSPLHIALYFNRKDIISYYLKTNLNINPIDNYGKTPLHYMHKNNLESSFMLLVNGADRHHLDRFGYDIFHNKQELKVKFIEYEKEIISGNLINNNLINKNSHRL